MNKIKAHRHIVTTDAQFDSIIERALRGDIVVVDTEWPGLDTKTMDIVGASYGFKNKDGSHDSFYVPLGHKEVTSVDLFLQPPPATEEEYKEKKKRFKKVKRNKLAREEQRKEFLRKKNKDPKAYSNPCEKVNWRLADGQIKVNTFLKGMIRLFNSERVTIIGHNIGFDIKGIFDLFKRNGFTKASNYYLHCEILDTMGLAYLCHWNLVDGYDPKGSQRNLKLKWLSRDCLNYIMMELSDVCPDYSRLPYVKVEEMSPYAQDDAVVPRELYDFFASFVELHKKNKGEHRKKLEVFHNVDMPAFKALLTMEWVGTRVDPHRLVELDEKYRLEVISDEERCIELIKLMYNRAKEKDTENTIYVDFDNFNINSRSMVSHLMFDILKEWKPRKGRQSWDRGKNGFYSIDKESLKDLCYREYGLCSSEEAYELAEVYQRVSSINTIRSNFTGKLPHYCDENNRIHCSYMQFFTITNRLSSRNPNLQNIPGRGEKGTEIRECFIPTEGWLWGSNDYSMHELLILAHMTDSFKDADGNPISRVLIEVFKNGHDLHQITADGIGTTRHNAKSVNYGASYGIGAKKLARDLKISIEEAQQYLDDFLETYPEAKYYNELIDWVVQKRGYTMTLMGNTRNYTYYKKRNWYWQNKAKNHPIQGSSADIIKIALGNMYKELIDNNLLLCHANLLLQVHDEINYEAKPKYMPQVAEIVTRCMETAYKLVVPMPAGYACGANWSEAH